MKKSLFKQRTENKIWNKSKDLQLVYNPLWLLHQAAGRVSLPFRMRSRSCILLFLQMHLLQKAWDVSFLSHRIHAQLLHPAVSQHQMLAGLGVSVSSTVNPCSSTSYKSSSEQHQLETCSCKSLGMSCLSSSTSSWPHTRISFFLVPEPTSTPPLENKDFGGSDSHSPLFRLSTWSLLYP